MFPGCIYNNQTENICIPNDVLGYFNSVKFRRIKMHRKKKIPVSFIIVFIISFIIAVTLAIVIPALAPVTKQFQGMIFFGSWLIFCFISVILVSLVTKKNR